MTNPEGKAPALSWSELRNRTRPKAAVPQVPFSWKPPDLQEGGDWFKKRMFNLRKAAESFEDPPSVIDKGIKAIGVHQKKYTKDGDLMPSASNLCGGIFQRSSGSHCGKALV